jgi:hypothetical protein
MSPDGTTKSVRSQKPPKLREVRFEDYQQIAALVCKFNLHIETYPGWIHLWTENPAYKQIKDKFPKGWVLETAEGAVAGYLGNVPLDYEFQGVRLLAATTRAWVVDTPYRSYSPLLLGTYFNQPNVNLFLSTTLNPQSAPAYGIFQTTRVPVGIWDWTLFWITNYQGFAESFLRKRGTAMAKILSYPISAGVLFGDRVKGSRLRREDTASKVLSLLSFDERFDAFWGDLRREKHNVLLGVRTGEALTWHFKIALQQNAAWIFAIEGASGLAAYAIFLRDDYPDIGLTRMRLVDFQCLEQRRGPELFLNMLGTAADRCRREFIHMLEMVGLPPGLEAVLKSASPHRRHLPNWLYFFKTNNPSLATALQHPAAWEPSLFDGDSSLWTEVISPPRSLRR